MLRLYTKTFADEMLWLISVRISLYIFRKIADQTFSPISLHKTTDFDDLTYCIHRFWCILKYFGCSREQKFCVVLVTVK